MVAAFSVARHGPVSRSAALRKIAARSSKDIACHAGAAALAASTACRTSAAVASPSVPSCALRLCGCTTSMCSPPPSRCSPPIAMVSSTRSAAICLEPERELFPFGAARRVVVDRLVHRLRDDA